MRILIALIAGGSIGFLIATFAFAVHDRWDIKNPADYQRGYEDGFREGRTRKELIDALDDDLK